MVDSFKEEVKIKTNLELKEIVINFYKYRGSLISAAKNELVNRNIELSIEEKNAIIEMKNKIKQDSLKNQLNRNYWNIFNPKWNLNIVDDINSPLLYSRKVINNFSIIFTVFFGGILLTTNLKKINNQKGIPYVLIFTFSYTCLEIIILNNNPNIPRFMYFIFNSLGSIFLYNYFWGKFIGKNFLYRVRSFWKPLFIGILLMSLYIIVYLVYYI